MIYFKETIFLIPVTFYKYVLTFNAKVCLTILGRYALKGSSQIIYKHKK